MTTIAADHKAGVMCSDSFWFDGDDCGPIRKVHRVKGCLFGISGGLTEAQAWVAAIKAGKAPASKAGLTVIRLSREGLAVWDCTNGWLDTASPFAIGSGGKTARGAMAAGASCAQAVRIACQIDATSGGAVRTYRLGSA